MDTQNLDKQNSILLSIKTLLEKDANLCNFTRYIDYGAISSDATEWKTNANILNDENLKNQTQAIRFVKHIDTRFLDSLTKYIGYNNQYNNSECMDSLLVRFNSRVYHSSPNYRKNNMDADLQSLMINLDCNYKIKGSSLLTALDFVCKNPKATSNEIDFYKRLSQYLCRLIFVGDKCHLLALIDKNHITYVSLKPLITIYENDKTENKIDFYTIVLKLFKLLQRCCIHFLKCGLPQYYNEMITCNIVNEIPYYNLTTDEKISLQSLDNISFDDDPQKNQDIKNIIESKIEDIVLKLINKNYYISNIDIPNIIGTIKHNMIEMNRHNVDKAYRNGLMLHTIFMEKGWEVVDKDKRQNFKCRSIGFRDGHIYIRKDVNIIPKIAYISQNGHNKYRILKNHVLEKNLYIYDNGNEKTIHYPYIVHTLFLDITDGILYCDGLHPNVSNGNVCMGDLKGKVTFSNTNKEQICELLDACESLLKCINYTSSYTGEYDYLYLSNKNSRDYHGVEEDENSESEDEVSSKELDFVNTNDFTEEVEETTESENNTSNDNLMNVESANEDDFEEEVEEDSNA